MTNQREGGIRRNLSAALEDSDEFNKLLKEYGEGSSKNLIFPSQGSVNDAISNPGGPSWQQLQEFATLRKTRNSQALTIQSETRTQQGISPVPTTISLWVHAGLLDGTQGGSANTVRFYLMPVIALWNPYTNPIEGKDLYALWNLHSLRGANKNGNATFGMGGLILNKGTEEVIAPNTNGVFAPVRSDINDAALKAGAMIFKLQVPEIAPGETVYLSPIGLNPLGWRQADAETGTNILGKVPLTFFDTTTNRAKVNAFYIDAVSPVDATWANSSVTLRTWNQMNAGQFWLADDPDKLMSNPLHQIFKLNYSGTQNPGFASFTLKSTNANEAPNFGAGEFPSMGLYTMSRFTEDSLRVDKDPSTFPNLTLPWLTENDPSAPYQGPTNIELASTTDFNNRFYPSTYWNSGSSTTNDHESFDNFLQTTGLAQSNGYAGFSTGTPVSQTTLFELHADAAVSSIAEFSNARLRSSPIDSTVDFKQIEYKRNACYTPAYQVGNSLTPSWLQSPSDLFRSNWSSLTYNGGEQYDPNLTVYDNSYLLNQNLYDRFFLTGSIDSTLLTSPNPVALCDNTALGLNNSEVTLGDLNDYENAASKLLIHGAFNINSQSVEAWKSLLSSTISHPLRSSTPDDEASYSLFRNPTGNDLQKSFSDVSDPDLYNGYSSLNQTDIDSLAQAIVNEIKARGPFHSISDFVNRDPDSSEPEHQYLGALEAAIRKSGVNDFLLSDPTMHTAVLITITFIPHQVYRLSSAITNSSDNNTKISTAAQAPGSLTQMDLLARLGPYQRTLRYVHDFSQNPNSRHQRIIHREAM